MQTCGILIVGGGIAGLACARALEQKRHAVTLVEKQPVWSSAGAGLVLQANALAILDKIGLGEHVRAIAQPLDGFTIMNQEGKPLTYVRFSSEFGGCVAVHRAELHHVLLAGVQDAVHVILGATVQNLRDVTRGSNQAALSNGSVHRTDFLIGADGLHSTVRDAALKSANPSIDYAGYTCWRLVAPNVLGLQKAYEMWGQGRRIGLVPLTKNRIYVYLTASGSPKRKHPTPPSQINSLRKMFEHFGEPARSFLATISSNVHLLHHDIQELHCPVWGANTTVLAGDAAHGMTPNLGQGVAQSLEDALTLALIANSSLSYKSFLRAYRYQRDERVRAMQTASRRAGILGQWENKIACTIRNTVMQCIPSYFALRACKAHVQPGLDLAKLNSLPANP